MADVTVLTQVGEEWINDTLQAVTAANRAKWIGWGTGADTADKTDTTLSTAAAESRTDGTVSDGTAADIYKVVGTITCASAGKTITNAGIFTDVTAGVLVLFGTFTGIVLSVGDSIQFTFTLEFT